MADPWAGFKPVAATATDDPWAGFKPLGAAPSPQALTWSEVPGQALENLPQSAGAFAGGIADAVLHPVRTAQTLADLGAGALRSGAQKVLPEAVIDALDATGSPETIQRIDQTASAVGRHLADRYGSAEGIKNSLAHDPVGVVADAAAVLTGGGGLAARAPGLVGRAGQAAQTAGSVLDPIANAGRAVALGGRGAAEVLGVTTGVGARPIQEAYRAGQAGNPAFTDALRGNTTADNIVDMGERAVTQMGRERSAAYDAGMANVRASPQPMDFQPVLHALDQARAQAVYTSPSGRAIVRDAAALETHTRIATLVNDFMSLPQVERTPSAFDALKQSVGDIRQRAQQGTSERRVADTIYRTIRDEIATQVPEYAAAMRDYANASDQIGEMRRTLSLNDKATTDTAARKLLSAMRNNVNANFGERERLVNTLAGHEPDLVPALAGMSMNSLAPRGLARVTSPVAIAAGGLPTMNPMAMALLPFTSPRAVGEAAYAVGRGSGMARDAVAALPARVQPYFDPQVMAQALLASGVLNRLTDQPTTDR